MVRCFTEGEVGSLAGAIDTVGFAVVEDFVDPSDLKVAHSSALQALAAAENGYVCFEGASPLDGTFLKTLADDPNFAQLCSALCAHKTKPPPARPLAIYQVLRCLTVTADRAHSLRFHYDSYVLTTLIPIAMPARGGDLLLIPNCRPVRRGYIGNAMDKVLADNLVTQTALRALYRADHAVIRRVPLKPGNLYLFWGYCSLHTNEPAEAGEPRVTALLHCLNPHHSSNLRMALGRAA